MKERTRILLMSASFSISIGTSVAGYLMVGIWQVLIVFPILLILWLVTRHRSAFWTASGVMLIQVILAAIGIIAGSSLPLMLITGTTALISWELLLSHLDRQNFEPDPNLTPVERKHLTSLGAAGGIGFALSLLGPHISLQIPFVAIVALVLIAIGGLVFGVQIIVKRQH